MSTLTVNGSAVKKMTLKDSSGTEHKVKKWYHDGVKVFSSGNICTYHVDTNDVHAEEIDGDESCLSPKTFTPSKTGYIFVGWREDNTANASILSSKTMGEDPIALYAVFKQTFSLSFANNYASGGSMSPIYGIQYYNNGNVLNPQVTLPRDGYSRRGITFVKWVLGAPGTKVTLTGNTSTRAVCKYPDNNSPYFYYGSNSWEHWDAGELKGGAHIIDGTKYSQVYIGNYYVSKGNMYVDKYGTQSNYQGWIGKDTGWQNVMANFLYFACAGINSGYSDGYINGYKAEGGSISRSGVTVNLPTNKVYIAAFAWDGDDGASKAYMNGVKLIGRTIQ